jgi:Tol biopolymer transport system component
MSPFPASCLRTFSLVALFTLAAAALPAARPSAQTAAAQQPPSPNGKIVFQSDQAGDPGVYEIYTMGAEGRRETRLTNNVAADDVNALWSPQGDQIAFASNRRGTGYEIFLMNADGSNQRPLRADGVHTFEFVWSPDGTRLAYAFGDGNVYVIEAVAPTGGDSTAAPVNVSTGKIVNSTDIEADWSPDGGKLVVRNAQLCGGCSDLYTVNADGTGRTQLTSAPGFETSPRWSPGGGLIAYEAFRGIDRNLYVLDAAGAGAEVKISGDLGVFGAPAWSPDGSRLAFVSLIGLGVHVVNADGSNPTLLNGDEGTKLNLFWSPDGSRVAFTNSSGVGFTDVFVVNADGTSRRPLNYTKTRRADETARSWQRVATP